MITFPVTPEAFISYQEQLLGRKMTEKMREATAAWVEGFNLSYKDGLEQDRAALEDSLAKMDELTARRDNSPVVRDILRVCRRWIITAWKQGFHDAEGRSSADGR
ncbi:hypothetical protein [uncultured Flavonifractor sp.]|mgnify:CR=1 FL=1|uniref:hypothetical protein n=1 Tax=uncultured Flavonifractor sp. TaxID=1193534 RepID=UPI00174EA8EB|nr:hypothetical protein [uncultured Flavonifractor sp.]